MKIKDSIRAKLIIEAERNRLRQQKISLDYQILIRKAKSVEEIMEAKTNYLRETLQNLPLCMTECYFCRLGDYKCEGCLYAAKHGICIEDDSDYKEIATACLKFEILIGKKYHFNEVYEKGGK